MAFALEPFERIAHLVVFAEQGDPGGKGGRWDWEAMRLAEAG
ncbi:protein of unknown function [Rhodovastum atsumiense]|nr:protein of unknown function [Rhodovastum atsumiense]